MPDLKAYVENLAIQILNKSIVKELCAKADMFSCNQLLEACVQLMVKEGISLDKEEVKKMPDTTVAYLGAFKVELDKRKGLETNLNRQREEISALRTTLKTKSSICKCSSTRTHPSPSFEHLLAKNKRSLTSKFTSEGKGPHQSHHHLSFMCHLNSCPYHLFFRC